MARDERGTPERRLKCTIDRYCSTLEERITGHNPSKQAGLAVGTIMNFGPGPQKVIQAPVWFIAPKSAGLPEEERGLYLNFCPWCGYDMTARLERFKEELQREPEPVETSPAAAPETKSKRPKKIA